MAALNPYINPEAFNRIKIGGLLLPGVIIPPIENLEKKQRWSVQHGIAMANGFTVWRGLMIAENIKINVNLPNAQAYEDYLKIRAAIRPKDGRKPPALAVVNGWFQLANVNRVSDVWPGLPQHVAGNSYIVSIILNEYATPKPIVAGPQDPPKAKTENDRLADQLTELMAKVHK
jgi:hypothetical protein